MNSFVQHIPTFVDYREPPPSFEFETTEELLSNEIVLRYSRHENFNHFAISGQHLMEISDSGYHWWVVGSIKEPEKVDLPAWDGPKYRK